MLAWLRWVMGIAWYFLWQFVTGMLAGAGLLLALLLGIGGWLDALVVSGDHIGQRFLISRPGSANTVSPEPRGLAGPSQGARRHARVRRKAGQTRLPL